MKLSLSVLVKISIASLGISLSPYYTAFGQLSFTEVASAKNLRIASVAKDGGFTWADFDNDGDKDVLVNSNNGTTRSRLLFNGGAPNYIFTDVTAAKAPALLSNTTERSAIAGDIDNDGDIDFIRNTSPLVEVYKNSGSPSYNFSLVQSIDAAFFTGPGTQTGINSEGMGLIDFDGDGDLDLFIEDHEYGIDLLINDGSGTFTHYTTNASPRGFGTTGASGDYSLVADMNNDGFVDIVARREGQSNNVNQIDVFFNNGNGTFAGNNNVNLNALNSNKGGVVAADLDADGDLDYFWTDNGTSASPGNNYIIEQTGVNSGTFALATVTVTGSSSSLPTSGLIDGVTAGDVNNDGKLDLFLTANSGTSFLLINTSSGPGVFSFDHTNYGINVNADGEGCEFVDFDNDGDLDLYINVNNGHNQMWQNNLSDSNYMHINALIDLGGGLTRPAVGATVLLRDCHGNRMTPIMEVNGGSGHGTQGAQELHFGLPAGINNVYYVEVSFVRPNGGSRTIVSKQIYPAMLSNNSFTIMNSDTNDPVDCFILPVKLITFSAKVFNKTVDLNWRIEEQGLRYIEIERSVTGNNFELIGGVPVSGRSDYSFTDKTPNTGINYYRLKFTESNGQTSYSRVITAEIHTPAVALRSIKPNPFMDRIEAVVNLERTGTIILDLIETTGKRIIQRKYEGVQGSNTIVLTDLSRLQKGIYILRINTGEITESIKLVKQ